MQPTKQQLLNRRIAIGNSPSATNPNKYNYISSLANNAPAVGSQPQPTAPKDTNPVDAAFAEYLTSLKPTLGQTNANSELRNLNESSALAQQKALNSGNTLGYAAGEAQRVGRNFSIRRAAAAANVTAENSIASRLQSINKDRFSYVQNKALATSQRNKAFNLYPGERRFQYNTTTGKNDLIASVPAKISTKIPRGTVISDALTASPSQMSQMTKTLEKSRGPDGYVDPNVYMRLYNEWIAKGGNQKDFLRNYPPQNNVNPVNKYLPKFLMPHLTSTRKPSLKTILNPFS